MNITEKRNVLAYLRQHDDGTEEARKVIKMMDDECHWADSHLGTIEIDDLYILDDDVKQELREKLGKKPGDEWTVEDCQILADEIYQNEDEYGFSNWLRYAIEYMDPVAGDDREA